MSVVKFVRTPFLQNTNGRLLLIIVISTVVKRELANETVTYMIQKLKHRYQFETKL